MDKNAIKKYAVWARRELIERVSQRAMIYGITAKDAGDPNAESVNGHLLSQKEKRQRQALIRNIKEKSYEQVMEEVAYTWFNRFAALRFMEVNGYLPSHIRVFTNDAGEFKPQILAEAIHLELDGLDMNRVYELESANKSEELFKYLLIVQCNALNSILPGMFQRIEDYTELLLPDYLLREGSVIEQMVTTIPEEDWTDQVQIIGWLYQYYNTEPKDKVFADLKKNIKITKENIPAATQLFTPDWIVHYMVENSLGRLWLEGHPNDALKSEWKYYLDEAEQEAEVQAQLTTIRKEYAALKPEEIRVIDPCMGSGHILCVLFDVLVRIYEDYGYTAREAAVKIVENNLWGLDIDERAAQLSYFAVMMKARQYDRRFFTRKVQPHVFAIHETNSIVNDYAFAKSELYLSKEKQEVLDYLVNTFKDAKEYGSLIELERHDYIGLSEEWFHADSEEHDINLWSAAIAPELQHCIQQAVALSQQYHVVTTNPPYMGATGMSAKLSGHIKQNYPDSRSDIYACFIERCFKSLKLYGFESMITMESWMFLSSFEKLRGKITGSKNICSLIHMPYLGKGGTSLGINFGTDMAVIRNCAIPDYVGVFDRIAYYETNDEGIPFSFPVKNEYYRFAKQDHFAKIPGSPIAYWVSDFIQNAFVEYPHISAFAQIAVGLQTGDNNRFLRLWQEVAFPDIQFGAVNGSSGKWFPYNKGGEYRKWYGNLDYVVDWSNDGSAIKSCSGSRPQNVPYYFKEGYIWSNLTSGSFSLRKLPQGFIFDTCTRTIYIQDKEEMYIAAFLNSPVCQYLLNIMSATLHYNGGEMLQLPVINDKTSGVTGLEELVQSCIRHAEVDWDSFENSWNYKKHPLIQNVKKIADAYAEWEHQCEVRLQEVKRNEEQINRVFIDLYELQNVLIPEIDEAQVTIRRANLHRDIVSFISYAVGCMMGRYSLDFDGIAFAGGSWDETKYLTYVPDRDGIIPICDDEYFEDDIVGRFAKFVEIVFGKETLEENLQFIASALGGKGTSREILRYYFINDFYADHCSAYSVTGSGKRPIYWLFDSGKKNGFKCLIYMHRYQPDTIARIRTDYVHEQQSRYRTAIADLEQRINGVSTSERVKLSKQLATLQAQAEELRVYEEKIHHLADQMIQIDLDDGVKHNYAIFKDVLAKIK